MKERTEIRGDPHRIFIFSLKPLLGAREKLSLEGGSGPGARAAVAAAVAAEDTRASFRRLDGSEAMRNATASAKTRLEVCLINKEETSSNTYWINRPKKC